MENEAEYGPRKPRVHAFIESELDETLTFSSSTIRNSDYQVKTWIKSILRSVSF